MAHLTRTQRQQIAEGIRLGKSNARIARELGVNPSTVSREIKRNAETREEYSAAFAHTMAASRQIQAARDRFAGTADEIINTPTLLRFSPYQELCLPKLIYWRPLISGGYAPYLSTFSFYFYCKDQYLVFTRFDQQPGLFRPSGKKILPAFAAYDYRCRTEINTSSVQPFISSSQQQSPTHVAGHRNSSVLLLLSAPASFLIVMREYASFFLSLKAKTLSKSRSAIQKVFTQAKVCPKNIKQPVKIFFPGRTCEKFQICA